MPQVTTERCARRGCLRNFGGHRAPSGAVNGRRLRFQSGNVPR
jgi:hypothetical protein